ncbi:hypothetical protein SteCoe_3507 [Stentor coeruleus]|uniref:Uncharacterized protein n=1 Tax=Stentor coeruleus TaxID=5963 RepID=A0A1R2CWZ0_9CILI|nr:hypothetical protein SteCoe_3507 [Stentor coeruleus]
MDLITKSNFSTRKAQSTSRNIKISPPRFQKLPQSPRRFKLLSPRIEKRSKQSIRSVSPNIKNKEQENLSLPPTFSPKLHNHIFILQPDSPYDLKSKNMQRIETDLKKLLYRQELQKEEVFGKIADLRKNCGDLATTISLQTRIRQNQLRELSSDKKISHKKRAAFFRLVKSGDLIEIQGLLTLFPELIKDIDSTGQTALHWAARRYDKKMYNNLIEYGADPKAQDIAGRTPESILHRKSTNTTFFKVGYKQL